MNDLLDLSKLITQHPGGYPDILAMLEANSGHEIEWTTERELPALHDYKDGTYIITREAQKVKENHSITCGEILEEIKAIPNNKISGLIAAAIQKILAKYNLPTTSDKKWLEPAALWFA